MDRKEVIAQGGIEKIGLKDSFLKFTLPSGEKKVLEKDIPEHTVGVEFILNTLTSLNMEPSSLWTKSMP